jgi:hypothetical protein
MKKSPTPQGWSSCHVIPSPPPLHRHHFETCVIPCTPVMDQAEEALASALVAVVSGTRSTMTASQVVQLLGQHYSMGTSDVQVKRYSRGDFLLVFSSRQLANQILHMPPGAAFDLVFQRWRRQARALSNPSSARFFSLSPTFWRTCGSST